MANKRFTRRLEEITKDDFSLVGGKGANLGEMMQAGLPVPGGFVILTTSYHHFVEENDLAAKMMSLLNSSYSREEEIEQVSSIIQSLFDKGSIPVDVKKEILGVYKQLGRPMVAVRSSATAEDLPGTSFAGQYNSYLNVNGDEDLLYSVRKCWSSLWNSRALFY